MKNTIVLAFGLLTFFSLPVHARKDCPVAVVENVQIESNHVLYKQAGAQWRRLGALDELGTRERLSAMLAAQMAGKRVMVSYQDNNYDCTTVNYGVSAILVRTYNN